jgi:hypothetical protein
MSSPVFTHDSNTTVTNIRGSIQIFRTEPITKYTLTTINTRLEAKQMDTAAKRTRLTHKIAIQLHLVAESCTICSSRSRRPVRKLLDTPSYDALRIEHLGSSIGFWLKETQDMEIGGTD